MSFRVCEVLETIGSIECEKVLVNELVNFNFEILPVTDHIPISQKVPTSAKKNAK